MIEGPVDVIAAVFVILSLVKLVVFVFNKREWYDKVVKPLYSHESCLGVFLSALALVLFLFLIQEFSIVQIMALTAFASILIVLALLPYGKLFMPDVKVIFSQKISMWQMIYFGVWFVLLIWTVVALFS